MKNFKKKLTALFLCAMAFTASAAFVACGGDGSSTSSSTSSSVSQESSSGVADSSSTESSSSVADSSSAATEFTVKYVYGNGDEDLETTVARDGFVPEPKDPVWDGYVFVGWYVDGEEYDFTTPVTADVTLTAQWEEAAPEEVALTWKTPTDGEEIWKYEFDGKKPATALQGTTVSFRLWTSPYYTGTPVVTVGGETLQADADGAYSFTVEEATTIDVSGLKPDTIKIEGWGTQSSPYLIKTPSQLEKLTADINSPNNEKFNSAYIRLENDLDLKGVQIDPIGSVLNEGHFGGTFDGNGHTVSNFTVNEEYSVVGFFGYVVQGTVKNLTVETDYELQMLDEQNYIVGGVAAYGIGADIVGCSFNGNIVADFAYEYPVAYVGGIMGFAQGYDNDISGTVSYCNVQGDMQSIGTQSVFTTGGVVGATMGTAESAPVCVNNCTYVGEITGRNTLAGGIVGYLRAHSSVANSFSAGKVEGSSRTTFSAAGGIVGMADNETAVSYSYTTAQSSAVGSQEGTNNLYLGKVIGAKYKDGVDITDLLTSVDGRSALEYKSYYAENGKVTVNQTAYDLTTFAQVKSLLGWKDAEWNFVDGKPVANVSGESSIDFTINVSFSGEQITKDGQDGQPLTQSTDSIRVQGGYLPVNWMYGGSGLNTFVADSGNISYGYFLDEDCTKRMPSAMLLTQNIDVYVGFADYSEVEGEYQSVITAVDDHFVSMKLDDNGKCTIVLDGMVANYMYVYDGEKVMIRGAYFANLMYNSQDGTKYETDFYLAAANGEKMQDAQAFTLYDNVFFTESNVHDITKPIKVYRPTAAFGEWYQPDGRKVYFYADKTGEFVENSGITSSFTYDCDGNDVTLYYRDETISVSITANGTAMTNQSGVTVFTTVNKFDDFAGKWETEFGRNLNVEIDGKGKLVYKESTYDYTVTDGVLAFGEITAQFNDDGLIEWTENGETLIFGREGSYIGKWRETMLDYDVEFYGINKDGYGYAYDSNGIEFTYTATREEGEGRAWYLQFFYRTSTYGYAYTNTSLKGEILLEAAVYTASQGAMWDNYNMTYIDEFEGTWNGVDGALTFNGFGGYDIFYSGQEGEWIVQGEVIWKEGNTETTARYYFNREIGEATFTVKDVEYKATLTVDGIKVTATDYEKVFYAPDSFGGIMFQGKDVLLGFDGRSNIGQGKAQLSLNGGDLVEYDYTLVDNQATLSLDGVATYTATVNAQTGMLDLVALQSTDTYELGYFSYMVEKTYIAGEMGSVDLYIDGYFGLGGEAKGYFDGEEVWFMYLDESNAAIYSGGELLYFLVYQNENNVGLFYADGELLAILCVADGWGGRYVADNGNELALDGRGLIIDGYYASASMQVGEDAFDYVYEIDGDEVVIYELDRTEDEDQLMERYRVSKTNSAGAVAYKNGSVVVYVTEITE